MEKFLIIAICAVLASCGGGGGGGGAGGGSSSDGGSGSDGGGSGGSNANPDIGSAPSYSYPIIKEDPYFVGDQLEFDGKTFTVTTLDGQQSLSFSTSGRNGVHYQTGKDLSSNGLKFTPLVMGNADAVGVSIFIKDDDITSEKWMYSLDGNWTKNPPGSGLVTYYGEYQSLNAQGESNGIYPIRLDVDFDNIQYSNGADLITGKDVKIHLVGLSSRTISATISDANADQNPATLGIFGNNGSTLLGGYANEYGNGLFLGTAQ